MMGTSLGTLVKSWYPLRGMVSRRVGCTAEGIDELQKQGG